jgi:integrase
MTSTCQSITKGLDAKGNLDLEWLMDHGNVVLDASVVKAFIERKKGKNLQIHGNTIRFAKRFEGKLIRVNLGKCTADGVIYSVNKEKLLSLMSVDELHAEKSKRQKRSSVKVTIGPVCKDYEHKEMVGLKPATVKGYKTLLNRLVKYFNHKPLSNLNHHDVESWLTSVLDSKELSWKSAKETLWMLEQILSRARLIGISSIAEGVIDFKNLQKYLARFKKRNRTVDDTRTLTLADIAALEALSHEELVRQNLHVIRDSALLTAKAVAARSGEARAIALEDISKDDCGNFKINVSRTLVLEKFKEPKNYDKSLSSIDVFEVAEPYLERLIKDAQSYAKRQIQVTKENNDIVTQDVRFLVINPITGNPYTEKEYRNEFYRLQNFANIAKPIPPKQLRHTAAKVFKVAGIEVADFSKQLTHANDNTTAEFYSGAVSRGNTPETTNVINSKLNKLWTEEQKQPSDIKKQHPKLHCSITVSKAIQRKKKSNLNTSSVFMPQEKYHQPNPIYLPNSP